MSERIVKTQAELDAALAEKVDYIRIESPRGVWLRVNATDNSSVVALGNSSVEALGNSSVEAWDNSSVEAWDNSSVVALDNSSVVALGNSSVVALGNSSVEALGNSSVEARDNSSVVAWGNSSVVALGNSSVEAWDNSSVEAWEASCIRVKGGKSITATPAVAVHLFDATVTVKGGTIIDVSKAFADPAEWCRHHGVKVSRAGIATVYKAVDDNWTTMRGTDYSPGSKPSAPDWRDDNECGRGLHFGPTPRHAKDYHRSATRFVAVGVRVSDLRPIPGDTAKCKAPAVVRACVEVDIDGKPVKS
jgi:hypothetical protein